MFKISFINNKNGSYKTVERFGNKVTIVTVRGQIELPKWWWTMPYTVQNCLRKKTKYITTSLPLGPQIFVVSKGTARRLRCDEDKPELAEKIAQSRAMIRIYEMLEKATSKVASYYSEILHGKVFVRNAAYRHSDESIYAANEKYRALLSREKQYLKRLIS